MSSPSNGPLIRRQSGLNRSICTFVGTSPLEIWAEIRFRYLTLLTNCFWKTF